MWDLQSTTAYAAWGKYINSIHIDKMLEENHQHHNTCITEVEIKLLHSKTLANVSVSNIHQLVKGWAARKENSYILSIKRREHLYISNTTENIALPMPRVFILYHYIHYSPHISTTLSVSLENVGIVCAARLKWSCFAVFLCSLHLRSCYQNMHRPWRGMHGSPLTLTAKVNSPQDWTVLEKKKKYELYIHKLRWLAAQKMYYKSQRVTFVWSCVNMVLVLSFSDLPARECFPAPAVSRGEFHHPHTCTIHRISWSFLPHTGKMMVFIAFVHNSDKCAWVCPPLPVEWNAVVPVLWDFFLFLLVWGDWY